MNKIFIAAAVFAVTFCLCCAQDQYYGQYERDCISAGGLCILKSECENPVGPVGKLCPKQAKLGFQCCLSLPINEKRCRMHGGQCFRKNFCNSKLIYRDASDCEDNQDCCVLV